MVEPSLMKKQSFIKSGEGALASYDWTDIAEGTGVIDFNGAGAKDSTGVFNILTTRNVWASQLQHNTNTGTTANFDLTPFNLPQTIKGTAILNGSFSTSSHSGSTNSSLYITFTFQHYDGTTYTDIGSVVTETIVVATQNGTKTESFLLKCPLTEKHFKRGDSLRIVAVLTNTGDTNKIGRLATDPFNRNTDPFIATTNPTKLIFSIPFKIDL